MTRTEHDVIKKIVYTLGHLRCSYSAIVTGTNSVGTFHVFATFCHVCNSFFFFARKRARTLLLQDVPLATEPGISLNL